MIIRPVESLDTPELVELLKKLTGDVNEGKAAFVIQKLSEDPVNQTLLFLVAESEGEIIASTMMERVQDLWTDNYIVVKRFFYIRPEYRDTLVGPKLLHRINTWAGELPSLMRIELEAEAVGAIGHGLDKRGYKPVSTVYGLGGC